jgi:ribosomal protein L40E
MKGLSGFMPKDDPNVKVMTAQTDLNDLLAQETELYAAIGKKAVSKYGADVFSEEGARLKLLRENISQAQAKLDAAVAEKEGKEKQEREALESSTCPSCSHQNPEGVKFCQECGAKLGAGAKLFCGECGAENPRGTRFCGECGAKLPQ